MVREPTERPSEALLWHHSGGLDPALDLAAEEVLLGAGVGEPRLLTWSWSRPVLVLGYAQGEGDLDPEFCAREGVEVLRRASGGTGVLHRGDLSASLILPAGHPWASGIRPLYDRFVGAFANALAKRGLPTTRPSPGRGPSARSPICFMDRGAETLLSAGRKVLGCAQARRARGTLVHGTLLLRENSSLYGGVFRVSGDLVRTSLAPPEGPELDPGEMAREVAGELAGALGGRLAASAPSRDEALAARELADARRGHPRWRPAAGGSRS